MLEPWNNKLLLPPPVHTYLCLENIDIRCLRRVCGSAKNVLSKQSPLHKESAILSRFLYKYDKKFRNDIGYRIFKKVNTALRRYLLLNFIKDLKDFDMVLPNEEENPLYLPTRQMLEYVLVRLMTLSKLMLRISVCCKQAAVFYFDRLRRGESHWMSLMPFALLSRVWSLSNVLLQHCCSWYLQMYPFLKKLQLKGLTFLPDGYELPINLNDWLDLKNHEHFGRFQWSHKDVIKMDPTFDEDDESDNVDSLMNYINEINKETDQIVTNNLPNADKITVETTGVLAEKHVDKGEALSRESFKIFFATPESEIKIKNNSYYHSIDRVTNRQTLLEFINKEESFRYEQSTKSLTNQLSFMQWEALKSSLLKLGESLSNNRKIQRKFLKLWKDKCLDCS
ncbi:unnamed protein product [Parnassius mnemosyne]|uniref:Nucleolus and neural progenitor protein-like N-terminal domain-containing protein n=1 Tax=Parnassius mnemosyne TaxID=213953 RepID=A0AAV1M4A1_9NEOP